MPNFRRQAQLQAAVAAAPQYSALRAALTQAVADRDSAIHAASTAYKGISHAIHIAPKNVKRAYKTAQKQASVSESIANQALASLGGAAAPYAAAAARESAVGKTVQSQSLANSLKELSDRRIEAAAGRAYSTQRAQADYQGTAGKLEAKRQDIASEEGLRAAAALGTLEQHASDQRFTAHQNALGRRASRINQSLSLQAEADRAAASQGFQAHENALGRRATRRNTVYSQRQQNRRSAMSAGKASGGPKPTAATTFNGRQAIQAWADKYAEVGDMSKVAGAAKKQGVPSPIYNAAADLHSKGHIAPQGVAALERMGVVVPKEWTGVRVRAHTRSRRR